MVITISFELNGKKVKVDIHRRKEMIANKRRENPDRNTNRGNMDPLTSFMKKALAYCGNSTELANQSIVSSTVQLWTGDESHALHNSSTEIWLSLP